MNGRNASFRPEAMLQIAKRSRKEDARHARLERMIVEDGVKGGISGPLNFRKDTS